MFTMRRTAVATNNSRNTARARRLIIAVRVSLRRGGGCSSDRPEVCADSGGVEPGVTPPPGSRPGVLAGSGSGDRAVMAREDLPSFVSLVFQGTRAHTPSWGSHTRAAPIRSGGHAWA